MKYLLHKCDGLILFHFLRSRKFHNLWSILFYIAQRYFIILQWIIRLVRILRSKWVWISSRKALCIKGLRLFSFLFSNSQNPSNNTFSVCRSKSRRTVANAVRFCYTDGNDFCFVRGEFYESCPIVFVGSFIPVRRLLSDPGSRPAVFSAAFCLHSRYGLFRRVSDQGFVFVFNEQHL